MPRSYGFDHFTAPKTSQPRPPRGKKPLERSPRGAKHKGPPAPHAQPAAQAFAPAAPEAGRGAPSDGPPPGERRQASAQPPPRLEAGAVRRRDLRDTWQRAGEHARGLREGAEQVLRAGRELVRLPVDLLRALRAAAREG